jgi:hypothetical protein
MRPHLGLILLIILMAPSVRRFLEDDMALHMLAQFPLILLAGWLLAAWLPARARTKLRPWNQAGIAGLLLSSLVLMFWMIPRALDLTLAERPMEFWKFLTLLLAGVALKLSWRAAGMIVRGFFLGNVLPMMMVVGWLYLEAPLRLCNAYLTGDQLRAGSGLLAMAIAGSLIWLWAFLWPAGMSNGDFNENE